MLCRDTNRFVDSIDFRNRGKEEGEEPPLGVLGNNEEGALDLPQVQQLSRRIPPRPTLAEKGANCVSQFGLRNDDRVQTFRHTVEG